VKKSVEPSIQPRRLACLLALSVLCSACFTTVGKWTYPSGRYPTLASARPARVSVVVERLLDLRSETNRTWMTWAYVPFFPGGWTHCDRPEATEPGNYTPFYRMDPPADLARSIAVELAREGLVTHAEYSPDGARPAHHDFVLRGTLRTFYIHETRVSYGVSINAFLLWALGLPVGSSDNGFLVELELVDARDGRVLWQGRVFDADHHVQGWYYGPAWYRFPWMWERRLRATLGELAPVLGAEPPPLPPGLAAELAATPAAMPVCLGVDSDQPCTAR